MYVATALELNGSTKKTFHTDSFHLKTCFNPFIEGSEKHEALNLTNIINQAKNIFIWPNTNVFGCPDLVSFAGLHFYTWIWGAGVGWNWKSSWKKYFKASLWSSCLQCNSVEAIVRTAIRFVSLITRTGSFVLKLLNGQRVFSYASDLSKWALILIS